MLTPSQKQKKCTRIPSPAVSQVSEEAGHMIQPGVSRGCPPGRAPAPGKHRSGAASLPAIQLPAMEMGLPGSLRSFNMLFGRIHCGLIPQRERESTRNYPAPCGCLLDCSEDESRRNFFRAWLKHSLGSTLGSALS